MIEQVFYRRDQSGGYNESSSATLSYEDAHNINIFLNNIATYIPSIDAGQDSPMYIFPLEEQNKVCIAKLSVEFYAGRKNQVQHGLLMAYDEYIERSKNPELIFGFTNKNFISVKTIRKNEMVSLNEFVTDANAQFDVNAIVSNYGLYNKNFIRFLSVIYTSLSQDKRYTCGLVMDTARSSTELLKQFGYLIMSFLPYRLRGKVSFGSASAPVDSEITVQILKHNESRDNVDVFYNLDTHEISYNSSINVTNFYLEDLFKMTNSALKDYFSFLDAFEKELEVSESKEINYAITKLAKLYQNKDLFASEKTEDQLKFIKDILALETRNNALIEKMVVKLLPFIDAEKHMDVFEINFELYLKSDGSDLQMYSDILENIVRNFADSSDEEKAFLFRRVYSANTKEDTLFDLLERLLNECNHAVSISLMKEYVVLFDNNIDQSFGKVIFTKIKQTFQESDNNEKKFIWHTIVDNTQMRSKLAATYSLLTEENVIFQRTVLDSLISIYGEVYGKNEELLPRYRERILEVFDEEGDESLIDILHQMKKVTDANDDLWMEAYQRIDDKQQLTQVAVFRNDLEYKYYGTARQSIKDLYVEYIIGASQKEIEKKIRDIYNNHENKEANHVLVAKILTRVMDNRMVFPIDVLKEFIHIANVNEEATILLAKYLKEVYLEKESEENLQIYEYLETRHRRLYECKNLCKDKLASYDEYYASKLSRVHVDSIEKFLDVLDEVESFNYKEVIYSKLKGMYKESIKEAFAALNTDFDRYRLCEKYNKDLYYIQRTQFGQKYANEFRKEFIGLFWENSTEATFDYKNREIYDRKSSVYEPSYASHENYVLVSKINRMFDGYGINWNEVYEVILTNRVVKNNSLRVKIGKDFLKEYKTNGMNPSDINYISLKHTDLKALKLEYQPLFAELEKNNYALTPERLRDLQVFDYISNGMNKIKSEYKKYMNYRSSVPYYNEVHITMLIMQVLSTVLLIINELILSKKIENATTVSAYNKYLIMHYGMYIGVVCFLAVVTVYLLRQLNLRDSKVFDLCMYGMVMLNCVLITLACIIGMFNMKVVISLIIMTILMLITIVLNLLIWINIGRSKRNRR